MAPIEINERLDPVGADASKEGRYARRKGFLPISLALYLDLLD